MGVVSVKESEALTSVSICASVSILGQVRDSNFGTVRVWMKKLSKS